MCNDEFITMTK